MSQYGFWLFDLDGTLVDVEWSHVRSVFDDIGDRIDHQFTDRETAALWHGFAGERNDVLHELGIDTDTFWTVFHEVEDPHERAAATALYEDARKVPAIDAPVGLVTHCQSHLTSAVIEQLDLDPWFDAVICCDDDLGWKPDPRPVERTMAELGVSPEEGGVLVGDGPHDIGAAWNAGLEGIHVERHGHAKRGVCVTADQRVDTLGAIDGLDPEPVASDGGFAAGSPIIDDPPVPELR